MAEASFYNLNVFFIAIFLLGLAIGSFINVVVYRLPKILNEQWRKECALFLEKEVESTEGLSLSKPASHCPNCKALIRPWENIPILSYLFLKGRCPHCLKKISWRYPVVELLTASCSLYLGYRFGVTLQLMAALALIWSLLTLSLIDIDHKLLPDNITLPLLWLGLLLNIGSTFVPLQSAVIGAILGYGILWSVYVAFKILTGKEGMGFGDFKLLSALGAWLGWEALPLIILVASILGAVVGISQIVLKGKGKDVPIPFGPYLSIAGIASLLSGPQQINLYTLSLSIS